MISIGLKDYLESQSVGTYGEDLFVSKFPDTPDNAFCLYDESAPALPEMSSYDSNNFGVKILVRGSYAYCKSVTLSLLRNVPMLSGTYNDIRIIDSRIETFPQYIETDEKGRRLFSVRFSFYCNIGNNTFRTTTFTP
nr:hypothetical protein 7 [bacterium]